MILYGAGAISTNGMPSGRQCESGDWLLKFFARSRNSAAAAGRMGAASGLKSDRILMKYCESGSSPAPFVDPGIKRSKSSGGALCVCQSPERVGFPSAVRGVGADRFGLPSGVLGIPEVG